ncbi:MAG: YciI family protein [Candidatus Limnocylindrales bacterium]
MQYLLLIYGTESDQGDYSPETMKGYDAFWAHVTERGVLRAGEALHPASAATTVRVRDGHTLTTDGPFAETKEILGGFYVVDVADLDEALGYAAMIPGAKTGSVEVRPIIDFDAMRADAVPAGSAASD